MQEIGGLHFPADFETFVLKRGNVAPEKSTTGPQDGASLKATTFSHPAR
jgi:hypothetical protein